MTKREWYNLKPGDLIEFDTLRESKSHLKLVIISINEDNINFEILIILLELIAISKYYVHLTIIYLMILISVLRIQN